MFSALAEKNIKAEETIYLGNDWNDLPCFEIAGWAVAVADAYPDVLRAADHVLTRSGGHGAVRELCDLILKNRGNDFIRKERLKLPRHSRRVNDA